MNIKKLRQFQLNTCTSNDKYEIIALDHNPLCTTVIDVLKRLMNFRGCMGVVSILGVDVFGVKRLLVYDVKTSKYLLFLT